MLCPRGWSTGVRITVITMVTVGPGYRLGYRVLSCPQSSACVIHERFLLVYVFRHLDYKIKERLKKNTLNSGG